MARTIYQFLIICSCEIAYAARLLISLPKSPGIVVCVAIMTSYSRADINIVKKVMIINIIWFSGAEFL